MADYPDIEGRWLHEDEDNDAEYIIEKIECDLAVTARCISDDEIMEISKLRWEHDVLRFEAIVPSSGYLTRHTLRFPATDLCDHEITLFETWKRVHDSTSKTQL